MLKIERGVKVTRKGGNNGGVSAQLRALKRGESVVVPHSATADVRQLALYALGAGNYATRKCDGGTRVWRTK
jgi:hypothetical protein